MAANKHKSSTRSRVEHVFGILKGMFGFRKVRYRGLAKNTNRLYVCFGLVNLFVQKKRMLTGLDALACPNAWNDGRNHRIAQTVSR